MANTFDSNEVSINFAGRDLATSRADGDFVTLTFTTELYSMKAGSDGEVTRSKNNDRSGKCTLKFLNTSEAHRVLTALYNEAEASSNGDDIAPLQVRSRSTGLAYHAEQAWISKHPDISFGKEAGELDWEISYERLEPQVEAA
ncbi:MAG: DUF3277 family protein [Myxococcaceae bacterium]|nr:MAG: DUF3277 family protein [Myxococcaceae bacterium]